MHNKLHAFILYTLVGTRKSVGADTCLFCTQSLIILEKDIFCAFVQREFASNIHLEKVTLLDVWEEDLNVIN